MVFRTHSFGSKLVLPAKRNIMSRDQTERSKWSRKQAQSLILGIFCHNYHNYSMFRDVPECSGMFHVPGFIDGLQASTVLPSEKKRKKKIRHNKIKHFQTSHNFIFLLQFYVTKANGIKQDETTFICTPKLGVIQRVTLNKSRRYKSDSVHKIYVHT